MNTVREARIKLGMGQKELARQAGIDARTLRKIENGEKVSPVSLGAVERVLGVSDTAVSDPKPDRRALLGEAAARKLLGAYWLAVVALAFGLHFAGEDVENPVLLSALTLGMVLLFPGYAILTHKPYGNTQINFDLPLERADELRNPLETVKAWLGRHDIDLTEVRFTSTKFYFTAYADFEPRELPALVARLDGIGVKANISSR